MRQRNSSFEMLRIVSMILIIFSHYSSHGGLMEVENTATHFLALFMKTGGKIGVICYVLITSYFMSSQEFKFKSVLKIILQTTFYSFLLLLMCYLSGLKVGIFTGVKAIFAVVYGNYWFVTAYIGLYLALPFLKKMTYGMTEKQSMIGIVFSFIILSIVPMIFGNPDFIVNDFVYFCFLFLLGNHLRQFSLSAKARRWTMWGGYCVIC